MRCYIVRGERVQALRQYRLCRELLQAELETKPEAATTRLYEAARMGSDADASQPGIVEDVLLPAPLASAGALA